MTGDAVKVVVISQRPKMEFSIDSLTIAVSVEQPIQTHNPPQSRMKYRWEYESTTCRLVLILWKLSSANRYLFFVCVILVISTYTPVHSRGMTLLMFLLLLTGVVVFLLNILLSLGCVLLFTVESLFLDITFGIILAIGFASNDFLIAIVVLLLAWMLLA